MEQSTITLIIGFVGVSVAVATYLGNKRGKNQQIMDGQRNKDSEQDTRITKLESSQKTLWRRQDDHAAKIEKLESVSTNMEILNTKFEMFKEDMNEMKSDIREMVEIMSRGNR